jgi:hypothetical protein
MLGKPIIKLASAFFALRTTASSFFKGRRQQAQPAASSAPETGSSRAFHSHKGE